MPSVCRSSGFAVAFLACPSFPGAAAAGQFEIYGNFGVTFPFYSETFTTIPDPCRSRSRG